MWIFLACFLRPDIWIAAMFEGSIVFPSRNISVILFYIIIGAVVVVAYFDRCIFAPNSAIASMLLLG